MQDQREQQVLCLSTGHGAGCGHPVDWHVGGHTPAPDCDCCSWRKNDPEVPIQGPAKIGPLGLPMREGGQA